MSATATPFGLRPIYHPSGQIRQRKGTIVSAYASNIFQFAPVKLATTGYLQVAAPTERFVGAFMGVEWTGNDGRRYVRNMWPANTVGTDIVAYFTFDPEIIYAMQADDTLALAALGEQTDFTAQAGSTVTGLSSVALDASVVGAGNNGQLSIVGLGDQIDNAWGDAYPIVEVQIAEHQFNATRSVAI